MESHKLLNNNHQNYNGEGEKIKRKLQRLGRITIIENDVTKQRRYLGILQKTNQNHFNNLPQLTVKTIIDGIHKALISRTS